MIRKVLINIRQLQSNYTGVQSYIFNITNTLTDLYPSIEFELATLNYQGGNQFIDELSSKKNVKVTNTSFGRGLIADIFFDHFLINGLINSQNIYFNPVNIVPIFKKKRVRYVVGVLDLCTFIVPETTTLSLRAYYQLFLASSLRRADKIIAISESTKQDIKKIFGTSSSKISTVYLGYDPKISISNNKKKKNYFLTMATSKRKNISNVLAAYSLFSKQFPKVKMSIVTNSKIMRNEIATLVKKLGINSKLVTVFDNYISKKKLSSLYSEAMCFVYCPVYEGFGLPVLEAMSCSCPVITSSTSSLPEVGRNAATLVSPTDPSDISDAMKAVYISEAKRKQMILRGQKNVERFSWDASAKKLFKEFQAL